MHIILHQIGTYYFFNVVTLAPSAVCQCIMQGIQTNFSIWGSHIPSISQPCLSDLKWNHPHHVKSQEFCDIRSMQSFISLFLKTNWLSCHITLCCLSHKAQKAPVYTILWVTLDSTFIRITSADPLGMNRQVQTSAFTHKLPLSGVCVAGGLSRQALQTAFKILTWIYV